MAVDFKVSGIQFRMSVVQHDKASETVSLEAVEWGRGKANSLLSFPINDYNEKRHKEAATKLAKKTLRPAQSRFGGALEVIALVGSIYVSLLVLGSYGVAMLNTATFVALTGILAGSLSFWAARFAHLALRQRRLLSGLIIFTAATGMSLGGVFAFVVEILYYSISDILEYTEQLINTVANTVNAAIAGIGLLQDLLDAVKKFNPISLVVAGVDVLATFIIDLFGWGDGNHDPTRDALTGYGLFCFPAALFGFQSGNVSFRRALARRVQDRLYFVVCQSAHQ